jgi:site-specific DNA-methyltransferase (adenine-specific)
VSAPIENPHLRVVRYHGEAIETLATLADGFVDAIVTDPPYELGFMGRAWDASGIAYSVELWRHCLRVLKPGGHLLAFGGTRTSHRLTCAIEDAGFEIRDEIAWLYGSGFPKSLDVSKAIDKAAGAQREVIGQRVRVDGKAPGVVSGGKHGAFGDFGDLPTTVTAPATDDAKRWAGWGTALKPAHEPIVVARKPLAGTVAANVLAYGTGALHIDACRVETTESTADLATSLAKNPGRDDLVTSGTYGASRPQQSVNTAGRWPTNVVLDEYAAAELDEQSGTSSSARPSKLQRTTTREPGYGMAYQVADRYDDSGGASRFFPVFKYQAKAPTSERPKVNGVAHPTVKPLELMRWLVRLVAAPDAIVLDPFAGSGTTAEACVLEGARCLTIERDETYLPLIAERMTRVGLLDASEIS